MREPRNRVVQVVGGPDGLQVVDAPLSLLDVEFPTRSNREFF